MALQDDLKQMADNSCLVTCYIKAALELSGENSTDKNILHVLGRLYYSENGALDKDCFVLDADKIFTFLGVIAKVNKLNTVINNISNVQNIYDTVKTINNDDLTKYKYIVAEYTYNNNSHFVLYKDGQLYFNSLNNSQCVTKGCIKSLRVIYF